MFPNKHPNPLVRALERRHLVVRLVARTLVTAFYIAARAIRILGMALAAVAAVLMLVALGVRVPLHQLLEVGRQLEVAGGITVRILVVGVRPSVPVNRDQVLVLVLVLSVNRQQSSPPSVTEARTRWSPSSDGTARSGRCNSTCWSTPHRHRQTPTLGSISLKNSNVTAYSFSFVLPLHVITPHTPIRKGQRSRRNIDLGIHNSTHRECDEDAFLSLRPLHRRYLHHYAYPTRQTSAAII